MRMKPGPFSRPHGEERGAVVVIVAICLVVLLAMLVLTVDLGGMVATRRAMVRGADSAALAAAQACAGSSAQSPGTAESYADQFAIANVDLASLNSSAVNIVEFGAIVGDGSGGFTKVPGVNNCQNGQPGYVTVEYTGTQDLFFAGIWGAGTGDVVGRATAIWARTTNPGTVPWVVTLPVWTACVANPTPENCTFEFPPPDGENPSWGIMDWNTWAQGSGTDPVLESDCGIPANPGTWNPVWEGQLRLDPPPAQWVCFDNGLQWNNDNIGWQNLAGGTWAFPLADIIQSNQPPAADMGHIVDFRCMSVPEDGITRQGNRIRIRMVPEPTCFVQGELDPTLLGLGPQGTKLVE